MYYESLNWGAQVCIPAHLSLADKYQKTYWTGIHRLIFLWQGGKWQALVSFWGSFRCRQPRFKNLSSHLKNLIWIPCFPQVAVHWLQEDHSNSRRVKMLLIFNLEIAARSVWPQTNKPKPQCALAPLAFKFTMTLLRVYFLCISAKFIWDVKPK